VATLRAGIDAGAHPTSDDVAAAVSAVLADPAYRRAATEVKQASAAAGGKDTAVSGLEQLVQGTSGG
jgi:UDP:flavonoid glycosyltransferase YjiC (YdhE family)